MNMKTVGDSISRLALGTSRLKRSPENFHTLCRIKLVDY